MHANTIKGPEDHGRHPIVDALPLSCRIGTLLAFCYRGVFGKGQTQVTHGTCCATCRAASDPDSPIQVRRLLAKSSVAIRWESKPASHGILALRRLPMRLSLPWLADLCARNSTMKSLVSR